VLERGVAGHVDDPQRERDLLSAEPLQLALAVPPLGEVGKQAVHGRRDAQPLAQHLRDLAPGDEVAAIPAYRLRQAARHPQGPHGRRTLVVGQRSHDPRNICRGVPNITGPKCVTSAPSSKSSALISASAVQPAWKSRHA
jgi:hypothetical protein